ncbi:15-hydroxyprostaglandin dehydrogenase [NAD(+)]-like isoform X2 [Nymphalis io]|uniref:15-hydroxyprostaglandin dehydrogenase [NAD(+)]-like isoform X1 n=1 Tax=Inachis io TaxID=171585 RepID=UPI002169F1FE|nr:15-hydroxyprostaglandin dehydrogenase [NAD(+)]-like isoform X1 [Nymphalis io]XP_050346103.1 15-hydroxyprostaglandin dehydrogenase [NAD(+)]-like isoform X2 [Nymphalis io]
MDREVKGKIVAVTGSAEGLGLAMVNSFLEQGAKLAIILDLNEQKGKEALKILKDKYGDDRATFYRCNVLNDLNDVYEKIINNHKYIDILINNAGVQDEKNIKKTMNINAIALMEWTMKFYENMRLDKGGRGGTIINVSSIYSYRITAHVPFYHASKYAVLGFSKSIGHETNFKKWGVRVVTLCPGITRTSMAKNLNVWEDKILDVFLEDVKSYDWQEPKDIGDGTVEIFRKADSGTAWLVEGARPAERIDV